jgi:putative phage-type endonuclease
MSRGEMDNMKEIKFKSKKEWLDYRKKGIGGSDASSIIGLNPYKTNQELWELKTGRGEIEDISDKPYVKYGTKAESLLRNLFKLDHPEYTVKHKENTMLIDDEYEFMYASLDGILTEKSTKRKGILEIKTTNILQSMQKEKWNEKIPDNYYIQILHYLMVTKYDFVILVAQLKSEFKGVIYKQTKEYKIERKDVEEDIKYLRDKEVEFWRKYVENDIKPPLILPEI